MTSLKQHKIPKNSKRLAENIKIFAKSAKYKNISFKLK